MRICAIISCNSGAGSVSAEGVSFFRVPRKESIAVEWVRFIKVANYDVPYGDSKHVSVCSLHFRKCCIDRGPYKNVVLPGHYPSVIDGKVLINPNSKCLPVSPEENLKSQCISKPVSFTEIRRAYLSERLNCFSVPKIVLGSLPYKIPPRVMSIAKRVNAKGDSRTFIKENKTNQVEVKVEDFASSDRISELIKNVIPIPTVTQTEDVNFAHDKTPSKDEIQSEEDSPIKCKKPKSCSPSPEKALLKKENKLLRKSVSRLETKVCEISEEHKSLEERMGNMEQQYHQLLSAFQNILKKNQQENEDLFSSSNSSPSSKMCTCKPVEVIDICD